MSAQPATGPNLGRLARGGALNLAGAMSAGVLGLALIFIVAHGHDQATAGAFFAATSLFIILGAAAGLGSDAGLLRWLPRHLALGDHVAARRVLPIALIPVTVLAVVAAAGLALAAPTLAAVLGADDPGQVTVMLRVLAAFLPLAVVQDTLLAATRGHGTMRPTVLIDKMFRQIAQVGGVLVVPLASGHPAALAFAWALPYLPGLLAAALWYRRLAAAGPAGGGDSASVRGLAGDFWRYTAPRAVGYICQQALQRADIVLMAALSSPRDAAVYTAATRFIVIGQLGTQAVQNVMQPAVSRLLALEDRAGAQRIFAVATTWTVVLTWPVHLTVAVGAPVYMSTFGSEYADAGQWPTVILATAMLLATATGPLDVMLLMAGHSGLSLANNAAALAVNIALNLVLIPELGPTGAATAWAAAIVTRNLLGMVQVRRLLAMSPRGAGMPLAVLAAVLAFGIVPLAARAVFGANPAGLAIGLIPGVCGYLVLLWVGRDRLALTAFAALLPGRRGGGRTVPSDDDSPRRVHVPDA
ncbi:Membrane protein involved in the export of O-antigen and teichoic acid [Thermomonospora echinospora]|uniref:Membrane protein involved in the export of O-antigen and teichoic acid n=1 Tax=Thermomonospora echinospora TaxID=1992 RepID=A0A1H6ADR2_9ACTN|nr:polysaccharide biosynthesis C-terminal domain-containing protein [Thermomonospora echinospora]SEG46873.1 Membrane protein involved in the export of O-antigen and teichoic acid [Thermomonospora echinospora]